MLGVSIENCYPKHIATNGPIGNRCNKTNGSIGYRCTNGKGLTGITDGCKTDAAKQTVLLATDAVLQR